MRHIRVEHTVADIVPEGQVHTPAVHTAVVGVLGVVHIAVVVEEAVEVLSPDGTVVAEAQPFLVRMAVVVEAVAPAHQRTWFVQ